MRNCSLKRVWRNEWRAFALECHCAKYKLNNYKIVCTDRLAEVSHWLFYLDARLFLSVHSKPSLIFELLWNQRGLCLHSNSKCETLSSYYFSSECNYSLSDAKSRFVIFFILLHLHFLLLQLSSFVSDLTWSIVKEFVYSLWLELLSKSSFTIFNLTDYQRVCL